MPSQKPKIVIHTDEETIKKLDHIASGLNRSRANLAETILKEYIAKHENENGRITDTELSISKIG